MYCTWSPELGNLGQSYWLLEFMFIHAPCENHNGFKSCMITHMKQKSDRWHVGRTLISASHLICVIHVTYMNKKDYGPSYHHMEITRLNKCSLCFRQPWEGGICLDKGTVRWKWKCRSWAWVNRQIMTFCALGILRFVFYRNVIASSLLCCNVHSYSWVSAYARIQRKKNVFERWLECSVLKKHLWS